jgi:hypothetical protein
MLRFGPFGIQARRVTGPRFHFLRAENKRTLRRPVWDSATVIDEVSTVSVRAPSHEQVHLPFRNHPSRHHRLQA